MRPFLDERAWRVYLGTEANALGYGGIAAVARASGASETTVTAGAEQARDPEALAVLAPGRSRRAGAGRPRSEEKQAGLRKELDGLLEEGRRGDPVSAVTWNILSLRDIARLMTLRGFPCGKDVIARLMHEAGYSLHGARREQRNYAKRARNHGTGERRNAAPNGGKPNASSRLTLTDYLLALLIRDHLSLPTQALACLLGIERGTVSHCATDAARYLAEARITLKAQPPRASPPGTPAELLAYAAANGIALTIPENTHPMPEQFRTRKTKVTAPRPNPPTK